LSLPKGKISLSLFTFLIFFFNNQQTKATPSFQHLIISDRYFINYTHTHCAFYRTSHYSTAHHSATDTLVSISNDFVLTLIGLFNHHQPSQRSTILSPVDICEHRGQVFGLNSQSTPAYTSTGMLNFMFPASRRNFVETLYHKFAL